MLETALRKDSAFFDFTKPAEALLGDSIATNMMMMGYAYQKGLLPLSAGGDRAGDRGQRRRRSR